VDEGMTLTGRLDAYDHGVFVHLEYTRRPSPQ